MIYVLGVNKHRYQAVNPKINPDESKFCEFVLKHVETKKIGRLAEEMNDEFLQRENGSQESVCRKLANARGIAHSMCEPNTSERQQIGYIDKSWEQFAIEDQTGCNEKINAAHSTFHKKQCTSEKTSGLKNYGRTSVITFFLFVARVMQAVSQSCSGAKELRVR